MNAAEEPFKEFPKITRLFEQEVVVTEKLDGTNALVWIDDLGTTIRAGSRTRWISPGDDNYGFAFWVDQNKEDLLKLGPGYHYGEWWGQGIQRKYGMTQKVFSLFNVHRWGNPETRPSCCDVVPVVGRGLIHEMIHFKDGLKGSVAAAEYGIDFPNVEGTMWYFTKAGVYMKYPFEKGHKQG